MQRFDYLTIGGGMTAAAAVTGIRDHDAEGSIGILTQEPVGPYDRPPLSKGLWTDDDMEVTDTERDVSSAEVLTARRAVRLDPHNKRVTDDRGDAYEFGKALIATGGAPRTLDTGGDDVIYFRTRTDYEALRRLADQKERFAVIGGGYIGSELAAALAMHDRAVTMIFPDDGVFGKRLPRSLTEHVTARYTDEGVRVISGDTVTRVTRDGGILVNTRSGVDMQVDGVVAGLGIEPNVAIANDAGLQLGDGIIVDERLQTSAADIYAAGDVASFPSPGLGRIRVEHEDNANSMGEAAGAIMAGADRTYDYLPFFYSDLFDMGFEAIGLLSRDADIVEDWHDGFDQGVVYYLDDGKVQGVLLWNVWGQVDAARELITSGRAFRAEELKGWIEG